MNNSERKCILRLTETKINDQYQGIVAYIGYTDSITGFTKADERDFSNLLDKGENAKAYLVDLLKSEGWNLINEYIENPLTGVSSASQPDIIEVVIYVLIFSPLNP